jgi:hypothetical protein
MRLICTLAMLFSALYCFSQQGFQRQTAHANNAILITQAITLGYNKPYTSQLLYLSNKVGDSLAIYAVSDGAVVANLIHCTAFKKNSACLITSPSDSLSISFNDARNQVLISRDSYILFPSYYKQFKQAVLVNHSVLAVLSLLEDGIGDYSITEVINLLKFDDQTSSKRILEAKVETQRSQADIKDVWNCTYRYNKSRTLLSVNAASGKDIRLKKNIIYRGGSMSTIKIYRNIEDRQIINSTIKYTGNRYKIIQNDAVLETGKTGKPMFQLRY